jgi:hypothetical protein
VVVFLLLLASGAGSLASRRWLAETGKLKIILISIAAVLALYVLALPRLLNALVGLPFPAKLAVSAALLIPLGFAMGMPFPTGLRALGEHQPSGASSQPNAIEWAWALNAGASVLGSVLAMVVAIEYGLNVTLLCGVAAYALALLLFPTLQPAVSR